MTFGETGQIKHIFIRPRRRAPMQPRSQVIIEAGRGIVEEKRRSKRRGITLIALEAWQAALDELGADLPIQSRRANFAVSGLELAPLIGQTIQLGDAIVKVRGETDPCHRMDEICPGLMQALLPDCRGGVFGEVLRSGEVKIGDAIALL